LIDRCGRNSGFTPPFGYQFSIDVSNGGTLNAVLHELDGMFFVELVLMNAIISCSVHLVSTPWPAPRTITSLAFGSAASARYA
jgi:hypothetical protein